jgi:hypothetical protein
MSTNKDDPTFGFTKTWPQAIENGWFTMKTEGALSQLSREDYEKLGSDIWAAVNGFVRLQQELRACFVEPIHQVVSALQRHYEPIFSLLRRVQEMSPEERAAYSEAFVSALNDAILSHPEAKEETSFLAARGWARVERYLSAGQRQQLLKLGDTDAADEYIVDALSIDDYRDLKSMVRRWMMVPYLKEREEIVNAALNAHIRGEAVLSVPALLPLVEGLAIEIVGEDHNENPVKKTAKDWHERYAAPSSGLTRDVIVDLAYKKYTPGSADSDSPALLNRHGILHGHIPDYGTVANSLRTFLLLDAVVGIYLIVRPR